MSSTLSRELDDRGIKAAPELLDAGACRHTFCQIQAGWGYDGD
jgi:hypothetical protein